MIYIVEDDSAIRELLAYTLSNTGYKTRGFENGRDMFLALSGEQPELILLDIMLPGDDGITILRRLRQTAATHRTPVIMLTAKGSEYDRVLGLDSGADDYITKPFGMMELLSRVRAVLRRTEKAADDIYTRGGVCVDTRAHMVSLDGAQIQLAPKEYQLLLLLIKNAGVAISRDRILAEVWGYDAADCTRTVDVHIRSLRNKLGAQGDIIETVRGFGYRLSERE